MTTTEDLGIHGIKDLEPLDTEGSDVFRARESLHDRLVAVKILDPIQEPLVPRRAGLRRKPPLARFGEEDGVVTVHAFGTTPHGQQFLVMPYFRIGSLADQLVHGPMPWHQAAHLIMRCAETVAKAHRLGVVLADIKPSSIMLADPGSPVLAVYGMATRRFDDGSPVFSAPEVTPGAELTPAADVYSLCLILAALLAGRPPSRGEAGEDLLTDVDVQTPDRVLEITRRGLSKEPSDRYRNGTDLAAALAADSSADFAAGVTSVPSTELSGLDLDALLGEKHVGLQQHRPLPPTVSSDEPEDPFDFEALLELPTAPTSPANEDDLEFEAFDLDDLLGVGRTPSSPLPPPPDKPPQAPPPPPPADNTIVLTPPADTPVIDPTDDSGPTDPPEPLPTPVENDHGPQRPRPLAPPIQEHPVAADPAAADPVEIGAQEPAAPYRTEAVPEHEVAQTVSIWDTPPTPTPDPPTDNPTIVVDDAANALFPPRLEEAMPRDVYEPPVAERRPEAVVASVVAQPPQALPGPAQVDESMPFRTFERQQAYGQNQGRIANMRDSIQSAWFNRRISFTGVLAFLTFAGVAGFAVTLIVQDFRAPTVLPTPTQTVSTIVRAAGPSVVAPTSVPPQLPEPASTHVTQAGQGTARRVTTTVATTLPPTSAATTTTVAPSTTGASATTEPAQSSTSGAQSTTGSSTTVRPTTTTTAPSTTDDADDQTPQGPTNPLIHEATASRVRTTTARVSFQSSSCVTAVFSYAAADGVATQVNGGARCATNHTLLLGTVTPKLRPGTTYTVVITVSDGTDAARETLSFTTLG